MLINLNEIKCKGQRKIVPLFEFNIKVNNQKVNNQLLNPKKTYSDCISYSYVPFLSIIDCVIKEIKSPEVIKKIKSF